MLISSLYRVPFQLFIRPRLVDNYHGDLEKILDWLWTSSRRGERSACRLDYEFHIYVFGFCGKQKRRADLCATQHWSFNLKAPDSLSVEKAKGGKKRGIRGWIMRRAGVGAPTGVVKEFIKTSRFTTVDIPHPVAIVDEYVGSSYDLCAAYRQIAMTCGMVPSVYMDGTDRDGFLQWIDSAVSPNVRKERKETGRGYRSIVTPAVVGEAKLIMAPNQSTQKGRKQLEKILEETPEREGPKDRRGNTQLKPEQHFDTFGYTAGGGYRGGVMFISCATADSTEDRSGTVYNPRTGLPTDYGLANLRTPILQLLSMSNVRSACKEIKHRPMSTVLHVSHTQSTIKKTDYCVNCGKGKAAHVDEKWCQSSDLVFNLTKDEDGNKQSPFHKCLSARVSKHQLSIPLSQEDPQTGENRFVFRDLEKFVGELSTVSNHCFALCNPNAKQPVSARAFYQRMGSQLRRIAQYAYYLQPFVIQEIKKQVTRLRDDYHSVHIACLSVEMRKKLHAVFAADPTLFVLNYSNSNTSGWKEDLENWLHPQSGDTRQRMMILSQAGSVGLNLMVENLGGKQSNCTLVLPGLLADERASIQSSGRFTRVAAVSDSNKYRGYYQTDETGRAFVRADLNVLSFQSLWPYSNVYRHYYSISEVADNCIDNGSYDIDGKPMETWPQPEKEADSPKKKDSDDSDSDSSSDDDDDDDDNEENEEEFFGDDGNECFQEN